MVIRGVGNALLYMRVIRADGELRPDSLLPQDARLSLGFSTQEKEPKSLSKILPGSQHSCPKRPTKGYDMIDLNHPRFSNGFKLSHLFRAA